jgi:hypothetical protein
MAKRILAAKLASPKGKPVTSMEDVMKWAFEKHTHPRYAHLRTLLETKSPIGIAYFVEHKFPLLPAAQQHELLLLLKKTNVRNARIHSRNVLAFMLDLILRHSSVPPPWRA